MLQIQRIYEQYKVPFIDGATKHKHSRNGWVQTECPFCKGSRGWHLGYNTLQGYFSCWRCGYKKDSQAIAAVCNVPWVEAKEIVEQYKGRAHNRAVKVDSTDVAGVCALPAGCAPLQTPHLAYLARRGYDAAFVAGWGAVGTTWRGGMYKYRIIAPLFFQGELVSFQGRDYTDKSPMKYLTAGKDNEVVHHKDIVYGYDAVPGSTVVIVEGFMDVWKLGPGAVHTHGIKYTKKQVRLLSRFKRRFVMYDTEDGAAREKGEQLAYDLAVYGGDTEVITLPFKGKDPGDLTHEQGAEVMRELLT